MELIECLVNKETLQENDVLLHDFVRGDVDAFEALFRQFQRQVHAWITQLVRDPAIAEDLTIEAFWRIHRSHARFDPNRSFGAWARRIATNVALDHLKTRKHEVALETVPPPMGNNSDSAVQREMREKIEHALRSLPPKLQIAAILGLVEEHSYNDISEALGISLSAVKSRIFRATRMLRKKLERQGIQP